MNKKSLILVFSLLAMSFVLSGCGILIEPSSWPGITADEDTVYIAYQSHVYALQLNNGNERWRFPDEADSSIKFFATPVLSGDGQLLVGSYRLTGNNGNNLYSLDPKRGNVLWQFSEAKNRYIGSPFVSSEAIFAPNADNALYKFDLDGNPVTRWSFQADEPLWAQPVLVEGSIYLASMDHHVYALDEETGNIQWVSNDLGSAIASPAIVGADGNLYVGTFGSQIVAINSANGDVLWKTDTEDWVWSSPVEADGKLYTGDQSGAFFIFETSSGDELWRMQADGAIVGTPLLIEDRVYFATESGSVYLVEADGENDWDYEIIKQLEGRILGPLVTAGDFILIGIVEAETDEIVIAIDQDGNQEWSFSSDN